MPLNDQKSKYKRRLSSFVSIDYIFQIILVVSVAYLFFDVIFYLFPTLVKPIKVFENVIVRVVVLVYLLIRLIIWDLERRKK